MISNFKKIHYSILRKCDEFPIIKDEIQKNGVITLKKPSLDFFAFLIKTIISQQISDKAAQSIWKKLCLKFYPRELSIKNVRSLESLNNFLDEIKISNQKKNYILNIYKNLKSENLNIKSLSTMEEEKFRSVLTKYNGIGPWTSDIVLIFFFNKLNILPKQDLIIKKIMFHFEKIEKQNIDFIKNFSPFLSILSLHFWKMSKRVL